MIAPVTLVLVTATAVAAWGNIGHELTGALAQALMQPATAASIQSLIGSSLQDAATWADKVKFGGKYAYTRNFHFVDSNDNPSQSCSFDQQRDCADGKCLTSAIANFTQQISCQNSDAVRADAVKFVMHFLGDLTQPLHTCKRLRGGNEAKIAFTNVRMTHTNLHAIWDFSIIEKKLKQQFHDNQDELTSYLLQKAQAYMQSGEADPWTACLSAASSPLDCAMAWAADSDAWNCKGVWEAYDQDPTQDFGGAYYEQAWPIIERQLIKAGVRAAQWYTTFYTDCGNAVSTDDVRLGGPQRKPRHPKHH